MKFLELGARVVDVEALFADGVVAMETDQHNVPWCVDLLPGLWETESNKDYCPCRETFILG